MARMNPWRIAGWGTAAILLLLPLVAMQFTDEVKWTLSDFVFMGVLFGSIGLGLEWAMRITTSGAYRIAAATALAATFLLIWINGAVGIIGDDNDANIFYMLVPMVALIGAILANFRPRGMALAMVAAAVTLILVPVIAAIFELAPADAIRAYEVVTLTMFFAMLWLLAAALFRKAGEDQHPRAL